MVSLKAHPKAADVQRVRRALISVSDKTGLIEFARALHDAGVELVSTGGTAKAIKDAALPVKDVADLTGFPEMMDGRVKTLHPTVHGGLLAIRDDAEHAAAMKEHGIGGIDLLVVNLYPFEATVAKGAAYDECVENIDIGGPAMIRAAAKNHAYVAVVVDAADYAAVLDEVKTKNGTSLALRTKLAQKAYARTAAYDAAISNWMADALGETAPDYRAFGGSLKQTLRYGENPHQVASFYVTGEKRPGVSNAEQLQGKELSYNNINDTDAAFELVAEFDPKLAPAIAIIKHANPCGIAVSAPNALDPIASAHLRAHACDPVSAFGGVIAANRKVTLKMAENLRDIFTEVVVAPDFEPEALEVFRLKNNLRVLKLPDDWKQEPMDVRLISGGLLLQDADRFPDDIESVATDWELVSGERPDADAMTNLIFAWKTCRAVKSNAIVLAKDSATVGIGMGQVNRVDSCRLAVERAGDRVRGAVAASDAFFPFADGPQVLIDAGVSAIVQPGGSVRDEEVVKAARDAGVTMFFTRERHFFH